MDKYYLDDLAFAIVILRANYAGKSVILTGLFEQLVSRLILTKDLRTVAIFFSFVSGE